MGERDESGQFTSAEPLFGQEGIEHAAGYVPYQEEPAPEEKTYETPQEAAADLIEQNSTAESEIRTYSPFSDLDANVTLSLEQAAKAQSDLEQADKDQAELSAEEELRAGVDKLRNEKLGPQEKEAEIDPAKILERPEFKEVFEAKTREIEQVRAEAETVKQNYSQGLSLANQLAQASFAEHFPEIAGLPVEQWESALAAMSQREPARFDKAMGSLNRVVQLQTAQQQQQQERTQREQAEFQQYARAEDRRFAELTKNETQQSMRQIEAHIPKMLSDLGVDPAEWLKLGVESKFIRSAAAQAVLVKAAKYDLLKQTPMPKPGRAPLPHVVRPGTSNGASRGEVDIASLEQQFAAASGDKQIRLAARIHEMRTAARR